MKANPPGPGKGGVRTLPHTGPAESRCPQGSEGHCSARTQAAEPSPTSCILPALRSPRPSPGPHSLNPGHKPALMGQRLGTDGPAGSNRWSLSEVAAAMSSTGERRPRVGKGHRGHHPVCRARTRVVGRGVSRSPRPRAPPHPHPGGCKPSGLPLLLPEQFTCDNKPGNIPDTRCPLALDARELGGMGGRREPTASISSKGRP